MSREPVQLGVERDGNSLCVALRTPTLGVTFTIPLAAASSLAAVLALATQPDTSDSYTLTLKGNLDILQKVAPNATN